MPKIHVDEQVIAELKRRANEQTPNDVIRQLLGLSPTEALSTEPGVYLIPHSPKEFEHANALREWLSNSLSRDGEYAVASSHYWRNVIPGSVCLFHKDKSIVGEGKMVGGLMPYPGTKVSPETGRPYAGVVYFDPTSVKVYKSLIVFSTAEKLLGKGLTFRGIQKLTLKDYELLHKTNFKLKRDLKRSTEEERANIRARLLGGQQAARKRHEAEAKAPKKVKSNSEKAKALETE